MTETTFCDCGNSAPPHGNMNKLHCKIWIAGARGYLGSHLTRTLQNLDWDVVQVTDTGQALVSFEYDQLTSRNDHNVFVFAAGRVRHNFTDSDVGKYKDSYLLALQESLDLAVKVGVRRFILLSTGDVYGPGHERPISESSPLNPIGAYAQSRAEGEVLASSICQMNKIELVVARLFLVVGPNQPARFLSLGLSQLREKGLFTINNPHVVRDFISVTDFCRFVVSIAQADPLGESVILNVSSGLGHKLEFVANLLIAHLGFGEIDYAEPQSGAAPIEYLVGETTLSQSMTGWRARQEIHEIVGLVAST